MAKVPQLPVLEFWYAALRSPAGIRLRTNNIDIALARLYKARADCGDPNLKTLSIARSRSVDDELWIVHREAPNAEEENPSGLSESDIELTSLELRKDG